MIYEAPFSVTSPAVIVIVFAPDENPVMPDIVVDDIVISDDCIALVPLPSKIAVDVKVAAPVPPSATPIVSLEL